MHPIITTIEALCNAMVSADSEALASFVADELSYGHTSGMIECKDDFLDAIVGDEKRDDFKWIQVSDHTITEAGEVVIARHRFTAEVLVHGTPMHPDIRVVQVWRKDDEGEWKLLVRQAFRV